MSFPLLEVCQNELITKKGERSYAYKFCPLDFEQISEEALISYIAWKDSQYMPTGRKMNLSEKTIRRTEFYNQKRLLKSRIHPFLPSEARDVSFDNEKLIVK